MALEERYENLRKSVNQAIKKLCNKIEDISKEVKEFKTGITKDDEEKCKQCACIKITKDIDFKVEPKEERMSEMSKGDDETKKTLDDMNRKYVMDI